MQLEKKFILYVKIQTRNRILKDAAIYFCIKVYYDNSISHVDITIHFLDTERKGSQQLKRAHFVEFYFCDADYKQIFQLRISK